MPRFLSRLLSILLVILAGVLVLGALALYFFKDRITGNALGLVREELAKQAVFVDWTVEPAGPGPGIQLKLRDITVQHDSTRTRPDAHLDALDVTLDLWKSILARTPYLEATTTGATLTLHGAPENVSVTALDLRLSVGPQRITLAPSVARFQGIDLRFDGSAELPPPDAKARKPILEVVEIPPPPTGPVPSRLDFSPVLSAAKALDYRQAGFTPAIHLSGTVKPGADGVQTLAIELETTSFPSQGKELTANAQVSLPAAGPPSIPSLAIHDGDASAETSATISEVGATLAIPALRSNLDWIAILRDLPAVDGSLEALAVQRAPVIELSGTWDLVDPERSALSGTLAGLDATWTAESAPGKPPVVPLPFTGTKATASLAKGRLEFTGGSGTVAGGPVRFEFACLPFATAPSPWDLSFSGDNLSLATLGAAFGETSPAGKVTLAFQGTGGSKPENLNGIGNLLIEAEERLRIPVVGPLIDLLAGVVPVFGEDTSDRLHANYTIKNGLITSPDLDIGISAAEVKASGTVNLVTQETQFQANANLRGLLGQFTATFSEILVVEGGGPLTNVKWKFKNLQNANSLAELLKAAKGTSLAPKTSPDAPGTSAKPASKAEELLRSVDKIGGLLKELNEATKPAPPKSNQ